MGAWRSTSSAPSSDPAATIPSPASTATAAATPDADDVGVHVVCARMTEEFLDFSLSQGNDLITAHPEYGFPGLEPG